MGIVKANFNGNPNVGLFCYCTDRLLLIGEQPTEQTLRDVRKALGDPDVENLTVAGTGLPGLFLAGNSNAVLIPGIAFERERKLLDTFGVSYRVLDTIHTCLGNNIVANDSGAVISTEFSEEEQEAIADALGVPAVQSDIAGLTTPGAFIVLNGSRGIIHRDATQEEIALVEKTLKVELTPATANLGTPYLRAAIVNNGHGLAIGDLSGGPEIVHIDESLGYAE